MENIVEYSKSANNVKSPGDRKLIKRIANLIERTNSANRLETTDLTQLQLNMDK